jgi:glycosyltransferase involved in cell wall biosynthesis
MESYDEQQLTSDSLLARGVAQTFSFGPALVENGQVVGDFASVKIDSNFGNRSIQDSNPRTGIGIVAPNHYKFVVVDGRMTNYSKGMTLSEFARLFAELGCTEAYNLDGGSGEAYKPIFMEVAEAGCRVMTHERNRGKGSALKTGFQYIKDTGEAGGIVCADSDGQHLPEDIMKIADALDGRERHFVLGSSRFTGKVPLRSRFGNDNESFHFRPIADSARIYAPVIKFSASSVTSAILADRGVDFHLQLQDAKKIRLCMILELHVTTAGNGSAVFSFANLVDLS